MILDPIIYIMSREMNVSIANASPLALIVLSQLFQSQITEKLWQKY